MHEDGAYRPPSRLVRGLKKTAVGLAGLAVIGSGTYFATDMYLSHRDLITTAEPPALAPTTAATVATPATPRATTGSPAPFLLQATKSAVRQQQRPSPTPAPTLQPDDLLATTQVNRLLQAPEPAGMALADSPVTVTRRTAADGSQVRVVSARRDLTESRYGLLLAADLGQPVGDARCTRNFRPDPRRPIQNRTTMLLCWRASAAKSVVTIAVAPTGKQPRPPASIALLTTEWASLG